ncbi:MAG: nitroreductase [Betaproteobacteria bacterium]|nr:nitroreductase [Betaproteobacteria bacterium]MDH4326520.1 nitroreductase [Betaproteobacteria bacterium]
MEPTNHDPARGALPFVAGAAARTIEEAILSRRSLRAFKPDPVPRETVARILALASRAPSGTNIQPWKVYVVAGEARDRLTRAMHEEFLRVGEEGWKREFEYYPTKWRDPYLARRRKLGWDLYSLLGIAKGERDKTHRQHARNYLFFDAPVGLIITIERDLPVGAWLDTGMFLQNVMLAARAYGLDTCPQAAIGSAHPVLRRELHIPQEEVVACGMSMGYARADAVENTLVTEREPLERFATFFGF